MQAQSTTTVGPLTLIHPMDVDDVLGELRCIEDDIAGLEARKAALRETVAALTDLDVGDALARPLATIRMVAGAVRVSYAARALDVLVASDPGLARILTPHRKETTAAPALRIDWAKTR